MVGRIQLVGVIAASAMLLAIVVLGVVSWAKNRSRKRVENKDGGGSGITSGGGTPGDWDTGSRGDPYGGSSGDQ